MTRPAGQLELFTVRAGIPYVPGPAKPAHGPRTLTETMRYDVEGRPRTLTWARYVCACGTDSCDVGWRR